MSGNSYHQEACRRQRVNERRHRQEKKLAAGGTECADRNTQNTPNQLTSSGNFETQRQSLKMFRVSEEGHDIRYRNRQNFAPHVDRAYPVIYPGKDNIEYTRDENRNNRIMNLVQDKYDIMRKVNGELQMKVLLDPPDNIQKTNIQDTKFDDMLGSIAPKKIPPGLQEKKNELHRKKKPASLIKIERSQVFRILHPYDFD